MSPPAQQPTPEPVQETAPYTLPADATRRVLLVVNTRRETAREVAAQFSTAFCAHGIIVRLLDEDATELDVC